MTESSSKVLKIIKALLAKTEANGCTKEEAAEAAAKVTELLFKHKLEMSQIKEEDQSPIGQQRMAVGRKKNEGKWRQALAWRIAQYHFCTGWTSGDDGFTFVGRKGDIEICQELHRWICHQLEEMLPRYWREYEESFEGFSEEFVGVPEKKGQFKRGFFNGAVQEIGNRMYDEFEHVRKANETVVKGSTSTALIVVNEQALSTYVKSLGIRFGRSRMGGTWSNDGHLLGRIAGRSVDIHSSNRKLSHAN